VIFVGRVVRFSAYPANEPLVFFRGAYRSLKDTERSPEWPLPMHY
jgi:flavin reductase (DIM6/NTAB) family NADH-FMN oxidoreductase RutF